MAGYRFTTLMYLLGVIINFIFMTSANAMIIHLDLPRAEPGRAVSSLQVTNFIDTKYRGKGTRMGFKKVHKEGFPDCYAVRFMTYEGELNIVKLNCQ